MPSVDEVITNMQSQIASNPDRLKGMKPCVVQFDLAGDGGKPFFVEIKEGGAGNVAEGTHEKPDLTVSASAQDFSDLASGKLNPTSAFMGGKIKVKGNMGLAMQLQKILG
jgi:putative sterol carrier protein